MNDVRYAIKALKQLRKLQPNEAAAIRSACDRLAASLTVRMLGHFQPTIFRTGFASAVTAYFSVLTESFTSLPSKR